MGGFPYKIVVFWWAFGSCWCNIQSFCSWCPFCRWHFPWLSKRRRVRVSIVTFYRGVWVGCRLSAATMTQLVEIRVVTSLLQWLSTVLSADSTFPSFWPANTSFNTIIAHCCPLTGTPSYSLSNSPLSSDDYASDLQFIPSICSQIHPISANSLWLWMPPCVYWNISTAYWAIFQIDAMV